MSEVLLDASALLAYLQHEPGEEVVAEALDEAAIGAINLAEVVGKLAERGMPDDEIREGLDAMGPRVVSCTAETAHMAGMLRPSTRALGLSLGDRMCLAIAQQRGMPILTGEQEWAALSIGVDIRVIR